MKNHPTQLIPIEDMVLLGPNIHPDMIADVAANLASRGRRSPIRVRHWGHLYTPIPGPDTLTIEAILTLIDDDANVLDPEANQVRPARTLYQTVLCMVVE